MNKRGYRLGLADGVKKGEKKLTSELRRWANSNWVKGEDAGIDHLLDYLKPNHFKGKKK